MIVYTCDKCGDEETSDGFKEETFKCPNCGCESAETELYSECCEATEIGETGLCSECKEHGFNK